MRILELTLENFQGIQRLTLTPNGKSITIYGDNATGKTTIFNAITWCLFGKPSTNAKNYTPKTKSKNGDEHNLTHSVRMKLKLRDGTVSELLKEYKEVYKKRRGSTKHEFSGHTTDYYVDGIPKREAEYSEFVSTCIADENIMKMLTMPNYFSEIMDFKERRKILLGMLFDKSDLEIIQGDKELMPMLEFLYKPMSNELYDIDDYKKIAQKSMTDINKKLQTIPERIDEVSRMQLKCPNEGEDVLEEKINELKEQRNFIMQAVTEKRVSSKKISPARKEMDIVISDMRNREKALREWEQLQRTEIEEKVASKRTELAKLQAILYHAQSQESKERIELAAITKKRDELMREFKKEKDKQFNSLGDTCPTCGQNMPKELLDAALKNFEKEKNSALSKINEKGKLEASKEMVQEKEKRLADAITEVVSMSGAVSVAESKLAIAEKEQQAIRPINLSEDKVYTELDEKRARLQETLFADEHIVDPLSEYRDEIQEIDNQVLSLREAIAAKRQEKENALRISELKDAEEVLSAEYSEMERRIALCELFVKKKVDKVNEAINSRFKTVRFRLFIEYQSEGIKDDCEVMIPSESESLVPYEFANNAARINAGLEIIDVIASHFDVALPVVIDNAESVTSIVDVSTQLIRLVVSEADKKLRVVYEE